jgi:hypothetical protein
MFQVKTTGKMQDDQVKEPSTDEVQTEYKRIKKPMKAWMFFSYVCCGIGIIYLVIKVKLSRYRPGHTLGFPGN